jgi:hypothetical protein
MDSSEVLIFLDDERAPVAHLTTPVHFELDTRKLVDGKHTLRIVSKDAAGKEGLRLIPFEVRNGPSINVEGIKENAVLDGVVPIMVNAYSKGNTEKFHITGSETPQSIPTWIWVLIILFSGWGIFYLIRYFNIVAN